MSIPPFAPRLPEQQAHVFAELTEALGNELGPLVRLGEDEPTLNGREERSSNAFRVESRGRRVADGGLIQEARQVSRPPVERLGAERADVGPDLRDLQRER